MDTFHTVLVVIAIGLALISLPLLRPDRWAGCAYCGHRLRERRPETPSIPAVEAGRLTMAETIDDDPHWASVRQMLDAPGAHGPHALLDYREQRSLAAQYLSAYADNDVEQMELLACATTPDQLLFGMVYVAYTHALVVAFQQDGDLRAVLQRDCASAIARLSAGHRA